MTEQEKADEIVRIAIIFSAGCGNTATFGLTAGHCKSCASDFLVRIKRVINTNEGQPHDQP